jgi:glycosyltransferase involved in cell wall biosynthesis
MTTNISIKRDLPLTKEPGRKAPHLPPVRTCALILARNEEKTIGEIVRRTKEYVDTTFVVDNGSTDNTAEIARRNNAQVIHYNEKSGYGAAQYAGHMVAIQAGFDYILQLDADGQHDPKNIPALLDSMLNGDYDIVLGSRFLGNGGKDFSLVRKMGITFFSRVVGFLGHASITDVTSGFKVYKASSLVKLSKPSDTHPALEQVMEIAKKGMQIKEIPIEMSIRSMGKSHLNLRRFMTYPFRGIWAISKVMLFK